MSAPAALEKALSKKMPLPLSIRQAALSSRNHIERKCRVVQRSVHLYILKLKIYLINLHSCMHISWAERQAFRTNFRARPSCREGTHLSGLPGRPIPAAFGFAGPLEAG
jgi:hypothetical protein